MSESRDNMVAAIKKIVIPELKKDGFQGSFPHFRRITETRIDLLSFQFSRWGGEFVVEIAKCPSTGHRMYWGEEIPPTKVTAHHINKRVRLGATTSNGDYWFKFNDMISVEEYESVAKEVSTHLPDAVLWWKENIASQ
jgi:hypothetical protein